ncbi:MAG: hypothetical protein E7370_00970 [Clostridiales bacterium]|nr:hypothetical protein [Clostridiales bacterium]
MHEFPDGVTQIGQGAFKGCSSLKAVSISDEVNYIGSEAFVYTGIYYEAWGEDPVYLSNHLIYVQQGTEGELKLRKEPKLLRQTP